MTKRSLVGVLWAVALSAAFVGTVRAGAQSNRGAAATGNGAAATGHDLYETYCASCHGVSGEGNGPAAVALRKPPVNLTLYAMQNSGVFPTMKLRRVIDGRDVVAHGSSDMPVWGAAFKASREGLTEEQVKARLDAIVAYLQSIQMTRGQ